MDIGDGVTGRGLRKEKREERRESCSNVEGSKNEERKNRDEYQKRREGKKR